MSEAAKIAYLKWKDPDYYGPRDKDSRLEVKAYFETHEAKTFHAGWIACNPRLRDCLLAM